MPVCYILEAQKIHRVRDADGVADVKVAAAASDKTVQESSCFKTLTQISCKGSDISAFAAGNSDQGVGE